MRIIACDPTSSNELTSLVTDNGLKTIGRSSKCSLVIPSNYTSVSGIHLTIKIVGSIIEIMDGDSRKSSTNGTYINGRKISLETWVKVSPGDDVSLGIPMTEGSVSLKLETPKNASSNTATSTSSLSHHPSIKNQQASAPTNTIHTAQTTKSNSLQHNYRLNPVSESMQQRLDKINNYLHNGYRISKDLGAFPSIISNDNRKHQITLFNNPAGFSWIGFFFAFAVCTQIKEWSYFYVLGITQFIAAILSSVIQRDLSYGVDIAIAIMYGLYFPYLRHMALDRSAAEIQKGWAIVFGLLLSVVAAVPAMLVSFTFGPA
jgi:hypothetical protein